MEAALEAGHEVTTFTRGVTNRGAIAAAEELYGDRDGDLSMLGGRQWHAVIDLSGFVPCVVRQSVEELKPHVGRYVFVSTISVYADPSNPLITESPIAVLEDESTEDVEQFYGAQSGLRSGRP